MSEPVTVPFSKKLFIHIGPHKTGSTAIQRFFYDRDQPVLEQGVLYPKAGRHPEFPDQHWLFGNAVARGDEAYLDQFARELSAEIEAADPEVVLLSTETLARVAISEQHFQRVLTMFPQAQVEWVLLLRNPLGLAKSRYSEQTWRGELRYPDTILKVANEGMLGQLQRLQTLVNASDRAGIRLASFDRIKTGLVEHFLEMLDLADCFDPTWEDRSVHVSLPPIALEMFRYINCLPQRVTRPLRAHARRLARLHADKLPKVQLNTKGLDAALAPYYADCRALEQLFFAGQDTGLVPRDVAIGDVSERLAANAALTSRITAYHPD